MSDLPDRPLLWDACDLLNLTATARSEEILDALGCPSYVVAEVRTVEALYLRPLPEDDPTGALVPVDLDPLLASGLLQEVSLTADEEALFVDFAREVDDGEARTAAVAVARGFRVATDDRAAIRLLQSLDPPPPVVTTPEWLKHWADVRRVSERTLGEVLRRVELCAHYHPRRMHPLQQWWFAHVVHP